MRLPKKSLGQNFLIDKNIIQKILELVEINNRPVLEIGPGNGELTSEILKKNPSSLILVEKDFELAKLLKEKYINNKIIKVYNIDILKFDIEKNIKNKSIIFGNLPYNISSQILVKIIKFKKWPPKFLDIIFMFQKELGDKIIGKHQTPYYGRLSILSNLRLNVSSKFLVSPNCFKPKPKVHSMVIHFRPKKMIINLKDISKLEKITKIFFTNKRKMINKNLKKLLSLKQINSIGKIDLNSRPSELKPDIYYKISKLCENIK